jgi:hypothetical protein
MLGKMDWLPNSVAGRLANACYIHVGVRWAAPTLVPLYPLPAPAGLFVFALDVVCERSVPRLKLALASGRWSSQPAIP